MYFAPSFIPPITDVVLFHILLLLICHHFHHHFSNSQRNNLRLKDYLHQYKSSLLIIVSLFNNLKTSTFQKIEIYHLDI